MQEWKRLYSYINQYLFLVYKYYSHNANACLCTYYNIDKDDSIYDNDKILGGPYQFVGNLSGMKWKKILFFPCFFVEETNPNRDLSERGMLKPSTTSIVFPSEYNIVPYTHDYIKFQQDIIQPVNDDHPIYEVVGVDLTTTGDVTFYKAKLESSNIKYESIEDQVSSVYAFHETTKKIYPLDTSILLNRFIQKLGKINKRLHHFFFDSLIGVYLTQ